MSAQTCGGGLGDEGGDFCVDAGDEVEPEEAEQELGAVGEGAGEGVVLGEGLRRRTVQGRSCR